MLCMVKREDEVKWLGWGITKTKSSACKKKLWEPLYLQKECTKRLCVVFMFPWSWEGSVPAWALGINRCTLKNNLNYGSCPRTSTDHYNSWCLHQNLGHVPPCLIRTTLYWLQKGFERWQNHKSEQWTELKDCIFDHPISNTRLYHPILNQEIPAIKAVFNNV